MDLFENAYETQGAHTTDLPLSERMRPQTLEDFLGQTNVLGESSLLRQLLNSGQWIPNLIFWGPPGSGKTTLAKLIAKNFQARFLTLNAVDTGSKQLKEIGEEARYRRLQTQEKTIIFIDEIHRLNKAQQDVLLPFTERGDYTLIGATTENPSYELNSALLSRCRVMVLDRLSDESLRQLLEKAFNINKMNLKESVLSAAQEQIITWSDGDARKLLNQTEQVLKVLEATPNLGPLDNEKLEKILERPPGAYDKSGDEHYDCVSAFIKSIRGSDADAGIYYLARMLAGGEDPVFIARRLIILASEDVGNADPRALPLAVAGFQAVERIGLPEGAIPLAQVVTYLASAPKSNRSYEALNRAKELVEKTGRLPIPKALRSARTWLSKQLGYGKDYLYAHEGAKGWQPMTFLPSEIENEKIYLPSDHGFEKTIRQYMEWMKKGPTTNKSD